MLNIGISKLYKPHYQLQISWLAYKRLLYDTWSILVIQLHKPYFSNYRLCYRSTIIVKEIKNDSNKFKKASYLIIIFTSNVKAYKRSLHNKYPIVDFLILLSADSQNFDDTIQTGKMNISKKKKKTCMYVFYRFSI